MTYICFGFGNLAKWTDYGYVGLEMWVQFDLGHSWFLLPSVPMRRGKHCVVGGLLKRTWFVRPPHIGAMGRFRVHQTLCSISLWFISSDGFFNLFYIPIYIELWENFSCKRLWGEKVLRSHALNKFSVMTTKISLRFGQCGSTTN